MFPQVGRIGGIGIYQHWSRDKAIAVAEFVLEMILSFFESWQANRGYLYPGVDGYGFYCRRRFFAGRGEFQKIAVSAFYFMCQVDTHFSTRLEFACLIPCNTIVQ